MGNIIALVILGVVFFGTGVWLYLTFTRGIDWPRDD